MSLTSLIWQQRKAIMGTTAILCAIGFYFMAHLPVAIFPQLVVPRIVISADAGDIPIESTLVQVTRPIEAAVSTTPGVTKVLSDTTRGSTDLDITFAEGTDMQLALQTTQGEIAQVRSTLPAGTNITSALINPSIFPIMSYSLTSETVSLAELRNAALYIARPQLARLTGVAQVRITGGDVSEFLVSARPEALSARGLTMQDLQDAIAKANGIASVGHYDESDLRYEIMVSGLLRGIQDISNVTVATRGSVPIAVGDVAAVTLSAKPPTVLASGNGSPGVVMDIIKQSDANTIDVAQEVRAEMDLLKPVLPARASVNLSYDQSEIVQQSEGSVVEAIVIGGALALIVLILFLGNLRAASIVLILLPLTLLVTLGLMGALKQTLNIMTLGALAIALGLVIDDGIVVVENIFHELEQGLSRTSAIAAGIKAITPAMLGSSITTMAAFYPLTLLTGVTGQFFAPLALVMIATLFASLIIALVISPLLAGVILPKSVGHGRAPGRVEQVIGFFPSMFDRFSLVYVRVLRWSLEHRLLVVAVLIPVAICSFILYGKLETGFFPEFDEGAFVIDYRMPAGTSLSTTNATAQQIELILAHTSEVASWSRLTGALSGSGLELTEPSQGDILVRLRDQRSRSAVDIMSDIRDRIQATQPALSLDFAQILQDGIGDIAGSPSPIEVKIYGPDMDVLEALANDTSDLITPIRGVVDVNNGIVDTGPQTVVRVDSLRASKFGLTDEDVTAAATSALNGAVATTVQQGEEGIDVRVQSSQGPDALDIGSLKTIPISSPALQAAGQSIDTIPLGAVANISVQQGSPEVTRENQQQMVSVTAGLDGRDLGSCVQEVQAKIGGKLRLPLGYRVEYGGLYASQQQSFSDLASVLGLAVLFVAVLLLIQFRSLAQTIALLVAAIFSLSGVLLGLFLTATPLNISSFTGAIMIVGIVTENGIVFFDFYNHRSTEASSCSRKETLLAAGRLRLRPILMTTVGAILALFPLALGLGAGAAMQRPLAVAVIGGLSISTFFTLLVAPVLYSLISDRFPPRHAEDLAWSEAEHERKRR